MKKVLFLLLIAVNAFGQDLTTDANAFANGLFLWTGSTPADQNCAIKLGYNASGGQTKMIRSSTLRTVNMGNTDAVFPKSAIWFNPCTEQYEVQGLYQVSLFDACGHLESSNSFDAKVYDSQRYFGWYIPVCSDANTPKSAPSHFPYTDLDSFGISAGFYSQFNSYPSGWAAGINVNGIATGKHRIQLVLNASRWFNQGDNCFPDTTNVWIDLDTSRVNPIIVLTPDNYCVSVPPVPCTDYTPISTLSRTNRTFTVDGSTCSKKIVLRYIEFSNQIIQDLATSFTGNSWTDNTALTESALQSYVNLIPSIRGNKKASYRYKFTDGLNTLELRKVNY